MPIQTLSDVLAQRGAEQNQSQLSQIQQASGLAGLMDALRKRKQEEDFRGEIGALTPEQQADPAVLQSLFLKRATPEAALTFLGREKKQPTELREVQLLNEINRRRQAGDIANADILQNQLKSPETPETKLSTMARQIVESGKKFGSPEFISAMNDSLLADQKSRARGAGTNITNVLPGQKALVDVPEFSNKVALTVKPFSNAIINADAAINLLTKALTSGNPQDWASAKGYVAKTVSGDDQSFKEIQQAGLDPSIIGGITDKLSTWATGTPSKDTIQNVINSMSNISKYTKIAANNKLAQQKKLAKLGGNYSDEVLNESFKFPEFEDKQPNLGKPKAAQIEFDQGKEQRYQEWKAKQPK